MTENNRQWRLARRPTGMVDVADFELASEPVPEPGEGRALVRTTHLAFEPAMRGWMEDTPSYLPPVAIGEVMRGVAVGEVVESRTDSLEAGDLVMGPLGWQEWAVIDAQPPLPAGTDPVAALSVLGVSGLTGYFGMLDIGTPEPGETVVVSSAAGAVGSVAGQIARIRGCRVVGIAGSPAKCAWLTDAAGFDAAIDYKTEDVGARLSELCPEGIDVFFDNVGGEILDAVLARLALHARIVLCGSIVRFATEHLPPGPGNYVNMIQKRARMEGFIVLDYFDRAAEASDALSEWIDAGEIAWKADVVTGFENAPHTLQRLYTGANFGKQLLEL